MLRSAGFIPSNTLVPEFSKPDPPVRLLPFQNNQSIVYLYQAKDIKNAVVVDVSAYQEVSMENFLPSFATASLVEAVVYYPLLVQGSSTPICAVLTEHGMERMVAEPEDFGQRLRTMRDHSGCNINMHLNEPTFELVIYGHRSYAINAHGLYRDAQKFAEELECYMGYSAVTIQSLRLLKLYALLLPHSQ